MHQRSTRSGTRSVLSLAFIASMATLPSTTSAQQAPPAADLAARVARLEQNLNNRGLLEMLAEIESLKREVSALKGELENQAYLLEQQRRAQTAGYADLDARLRAQTGGLAPAAGAVAAPPLSVLPASPADAVAGTPAAQGDLQLQMQTSPAAPTSAVIDASGLPAPPPPQAGAAVDPATGLPMVPAAVGSVPQQMPAAPLKAPTPIGGVTPPPAVPPAPVMPVAEDPASEAAYQNAFTLLKSGEYDQAIAAFEAFQQQYPGSQFGDNAQFWLAEAHYVKRDFAKALPAYQAMLVNYPASKKLSHAMLKIGYSYAELGQAAEARTVFTELQQRFPGTAAAQLATQRLAQLPKS
ncbi:MAG: tol-pal system protein YbgF [Gammaproteobacteria bacterium]|nr:tol-pal system protein YbgF [Gammaproteobacteria bacterium]